MSSITEVLMVAVPAALGSSVVSTLITTYATQSRERRQARAEVRDAMRAVESAVVAAKTSEAEMREILDGFARAAMLACLPVRLVDLFFVADRKVWTVQHLPPGEVVHPVTRTAVLKVSAEAFSLLVDAS